jgi:hypothetical protein
VTVRTKTCVGIPFSSFVGVDPSGTDLTCSGTLGTPVGNIIGSPIDAFVLSESSDVLSIQPACCSSSSCSGAVVVGVSAKKNPSLLFTPVCSSPSKSCLVVWDGVSKLVAYDGLLLTGDIWTLDVSQMVPNAVMVSESFAVDSETGVIYAATPHGATTDFLLLQISTAGVLSTVRVSSPLLGSATPFALVYDNGFFFVTGGDLDDATASILALSAASKAVSWVAPLKLADRGQKLLPLAVTHDAVWATTRSLDWYKIDRASGKIDFYFGLGTSSGTIVVGDDGTVYTAELQTVEPNLLIVLALDASTTTNKFEYQEPVDLRVAQAGGLALAIGITGELIVSSNNYIVSIGVSPTPLPSSSNKAPFQNIAVIAGASIAGVAACCLCVWCARSRAFWGSGLLSDDPNSPYARLDSNASGGASERGRAGPGRAENGLGSSDALNFTTSYGAAKRSR